jgi:large repetitive protein
MRQRHRSRLTYAGIGGAGVSLAAILVLALAGLVALSSASTARSRGSRTQRRAEAAKPVHCGDTITADTTLHHDLVDCPNNGIRIGADNVTLDLNGHTIDGDGKPFAACGRRETCDSGVVAEGPDNVTVKHGTVREFSFIGLNLGGAGPPAHPNRGRHTRVLDVSAVNDEVFPIGLYECVRCLVKNSAGIGSTAHDSSGLILLYSHEVRVLHNSFLRNRGHGIFGFKTSDILIRGNLLSRNPAGIAFEESNNRNEVRRNRFVRDSIGLDLGDAKGSVVARNRFSHMIRRSGHYKGRAITVCCANHNLIARNSIRDTDGTAIALGDFGGVGNVVRGNRIHGAGNDGVHVFGKKKPKHTLLKRNHVFGSKDDGIEADAPTTKLTRNEARRNGELGIAAVPGVIDGGGNRASGNGDPRQCTNIVCR